MKRRLLISFLVLAVFLLGSTAVASAAVIEWGPVQHGVFAPYYEEATHSDQGFDLSTGQMTTDPANRDFILYEGLWLVKVKGIDNYWDELLTAPTDEPDSLVETEYTLFPDTTYLIRCQDDTYAKIKVTSERPEGVEFDYVLQKNASTPASPAGNTPGTTPSTASPGTSSSATTGPVTIINNNTTINQNTNTTTNNANTTTNISGSTIANSNIASNNQTSQTTSNNNAITVSKYVNVTVNGQSLQSDVKPFVNADGRTMLPIRAISEALGAQVQWDEATKTATLTLGDKTVKVPVGQSTIDVNGNPVPMDTSAVVKDGRTLLPVRAVGEALGAKIGWDQQSGTVSIDK